MRGRSSPGSIRTWTRCASALLRGDFPLGVYHQFTIHDPKERLITAPCFRERVLHHALMNVCEPVFERWLIADTFACRKGKGRIAALERARTFPGRFPFFLKIDIRKYFDSISHTILIGPAAADLQGRPSARCCSIGSSPPTRPAPGRGLPIGSLTSQHFANFYLGWFDRFVKEDLAGSRLRAVHGRLCLVGRLARGAARPTRRRVRLPVATSLDLELKANPYINRSAHGLDFLGCRVFPGRLELNRRSRVRFRRKLQGLEGAFQAGRIDEPALQQRATALVAFARTRGLSAWRFRRRVLNSLAVGGLKASNRVNRGGGWNNKPRNARSANRNRNTPENRNNNLGFRLARAQRTWWMPWRTEPAALPSRWPSCRAKGLLEPPGAGSKARTLRAAIPRAEPAPVAGEDRQPSGQRLRPVTKRLDQLVDGSVGIVAHLRGFCPTFEQRQVVVQPGGPDPAFFDQPDPVLA